MLLHVEISLALSQNKSCCCFLFYGKKKKLKSKIRKINKYNLKLESFFFIIYFK